MGLAPAGKTCTLPNMSDVESLWRIKTLVAEIALDAVLAEAKADEVVVVRRSSHFGMQIIASKLKSEWPDLIESTSELRQALSETRSFKEHKQLGDHRHCLYVKVAGSGGPLAAFVIRDRAFGDVEQERIGRLLRSVLLSVDDHGVEEPLVLVTLERHSHGHKAVVTVDLDDVKPAMAINSDAVVATATAATALAENPVSLRFAAQTSLEDGTVSIVLVEADDGGPIFGVSFDRGRAETGPVAAVFRASRFVDAPSLATV